MSDMSVAVASRIAAPLSLAKTGTLSQRSPLGLWPTLIWGTAGIAALLSVWLTNQALDALWNLRLPRLAHFLLLDQIAVITVVVVAVWISGRSFREYLALVPLRCRDVGRGVGCGILAFIGGVAIVILTRLLLMALGEAASHTPPTVGTLPFDTETMLILLSRWLSMVVAAPIVEELLFRGLIYRGLAESRLGAVGAIVLTSLAFGLVHYPGPYGGWPAVAMAIYGGVLFTWLRWRTGGTSVPIVAHATANFFGALLLTVTILELL
jgi:membrane protease YdiL (CAAX protease family)